MTKKQKILMTIGTSIAVPLIILGVKKERELENLRKDIDTIPWEFDKNEKKTWLTKWTMLWNN